MQLLIFFKGSKKKTTFKMLFDLNVSVFSWFVIPEKKSSFILLNLKPPACWNLK